MLRSLAPMSRASLVWPGKQPSSYQAYFQEHRIGELRTDRNVGLGENEIRDLREAVPCGRVGTGELYVSLFEDVTYRPRSGKLHNAIIRPFRGRSGVIHSPPAPARRQAMA